MPSTKESSSIRPSHKSRGSNVSGSSRTSNASGRSRTSNASGRSRKRSSSNSRRGRSSNRSKRHSTRSRKTSKKKAEKALKRKQELEMMYQARTRQAGLQAIRAVVVSLQIVTTFVMMAAFITSGFDTMASEVLGFYIASVFVEVCLAVIAISLVFLYKNVLRWMFWFSYLAILVADILVMFYIMKVNSKVDLSQRCKVEPDYQYCSKITGMDIRVNVFMLTCFLTFMHFLILTLSMCWRECHDGSMDQLMENKLGQRLIKKHSSRNGSVRSERSTKSRRVVKKRSTPLTETIHFMNRRSEDFAHQIITKDGSARTGIVVTSTSEIRTHRPKQCKKTVIEDRNIFLGTGDKIVKLSAAPTRVIQQTIDCNRDDCLKMRKDVFSRFDSMPKDVAISNVSENQKDSGSQRPIEQ